MCLPGNMAESVESSRLNTVATNNQKKETISIATSFYNLLVLYDLTTVMLDFKYNNI